MTKGQEDILKRHADQIIDEAEDLECGLVDSDDALPVAKAYLALRDRVEELEGALAPFAAIRLSTMYSDDEDEGYYAGLEAPYNKAEFRRHDVLRAREALSPTRGRRT